MATGDPGHERYDEPRWPVATAVIAVLVLLMLLPGRVRVLPPWGVTLFVLAVLIPMAGVAVSGARPRWLLAERILTLSFCAVVGVLSALGLVFLVFAMMEKPDLATGIRLLSSGTAIWATNIVVFSMLYWQLDRGGPGARMNRVRRFPDWQFPQTSASEDAPPDWQPRYVDYLALAFNTATAFSPTDVLPLTGRAKLLMMLQSLLSLVTIAVVASRAINILGS